jgi:hypothetical protein
VRWSAIAKLYELRKSQYAERIEILLAARLGDTEEVTLVTANRTKTRTIDSRARDVLDTMPTNRDFRLTHTQWRDVTYPDMKKSLAEAIGEDSVRPKLGGSEQGENAEASGSQSSAMSSPTAFATSSKQPLWLLIGVTGLAIITGVIVASKLLFRR